MNFKLLLIIALLSFACSPLKRLKRFEKRHPYLFIEKTDSVLVRDTIHVFIPGQKIDTSVHIDHLMDTVYLFRNGLSSKIWRVKDSIHIVTQSDTVYLQVPYEKKVFIRSKVPYKKPRDSLRWFIDRLRFILFLGLALFFADLIRRKKY